MFNLENIWGFKKQFDDRECYISFTDVCNWKCPYCDFPDKKKVHVDFEKMKEQIDLIKQCEIDSGLKWEYQIEGGELGTLPEKHLDWFFFESNLDKSYHLATNGLFIDKYWNKYGKYIHTMLFHTRPDFTDGDSTDIKIYDLDFPANAMYYVIVVHKNNLEIFEQLLKKYPNVMWFPHVLQPRVKGLDIMDKSYYEKIYNIVKESENVHESFRNRYKYISDLTNEKVLKTRRKMCANSMTKFVISLPNNSISRCCISTGTSTVELNYENLLKLFKGISPFPAEEPVCDGCIANFLFRDYFSNPNDKRTKQILKNMSN